MRLPTLALLALLPTAALAQSAELKHDLATVRAIDPTSGQLVGDTQAGQVRYDVTAAQALDETGKPIGTATQALKAGDKVRLDYVVSGGAKVSVVRRVK